MVKVPLIAEGLKAVKVLTAKGIKTNVTLCFTATQALLAAKAGATYISPFVGRLDDISTEGMQVIRDIRLIYDNYGYRNPDPHRQRPLAHALPRSGAASAATSSPRPGRCSRR